MGKAECCHDCGALEGEIHEYGCDMEWCPFCGGQLILCDCCYEKLGLDCSPGTRVYNEGPSEEEEERWIAILEEGGRRPYILYPNLCARCGQLWPDMFRVPDEEWRRYIDPAERGCMLCRACYDEIKALIDGGQTHRPRLLKAR